MNHVAATKLSRKMGWKMLNLVDEMFSKRLNFDMQCKIIFTTFEVWVWQGFYLILSWWRPLSYRNQSTELQSKSMDWFLYDSGLRHERVRSLIFQNCLDIVCTSLEKCFSCNKKGFFHPSKRSGIPTCITSLTQSKWKQSAVLSSWNLGIITTNIISADELYFIIYLPYTYKLHLQKNCVSWLSMYHVATYHMV